SLIVTLERDARQSQDPSRRALFLHRVARIHSDRLGNRTEAIAALVKANDALPGDRLVLEDLAREDEQDEAFDGVGEVLALQVGLAADNAERVALLHRLGLLLEGPLAHPESAIDRYREALALEPTSIPILQALGRLLAGRKL